MKWQHLLVLAVVVLLLFGKGRFSDMMSDVAKGIKSFKKGLSEDDAAAAATPPQRPVAQLQEQPPMEPNADPKAHPMESDRPQS